jgi:septum formation protein
LASESPYRKELLTRLAITFDCIPSDIDEDKEKSIIDNPLELTKKLAFLKAKKIANDHYDAVVIGSDQVSVLGKEILGKPHTTQNAVKQLLSMSGQKHELVTSVCVLYQNQVFEWQDTTTLLMRSLTSDQCRDYVIKDDPLKCAGSYKIESLGITLFESIDTKDFTAITGLPLISLTTVLKELKVLS